MKCRIVCVVVGFLLSVLFLAAQTPGSSPTLGQVPPLVNLSGVLTDANGKPLTGVVGVTFSLYQGRQGGSPLWLETQNVRPNLAGHFTVVLGSTTSQGIPANLFATAEARWLGVQVQGRAEEPRVLLVSAPYALKAGDAETLGGRPASAFMAAPDSSSLASGSSEAAVINSASAARSAPALSGRGKTDYLPLWVSSTKLGNSTLYQTGGEVGIGTTSPRSILEADVAGAGGKLGPSVTLTNTAGGASSGASVDFNTYAPFGKGTYNPSSRIEAVDQGNYADSILFQTNKPGSANNGLLTDMVVTPTGNVGIGTTTPAATLDVMGNVNALTGFNLGGTAFAFGSASNFNAFLGFAGNSTVTGTNNTASGFAALASNTTGTKNTAVGYQSLFSNTAFNLAVAVGFQALYNLNSTNPAGSSDTAVGPQALYNTTTGIYDTAVGTFALANDNTGSWNTAIGANAGIPVDDSKLTGIGNTAVGFGADFSTGSLTNASAIGYLAEVAESNAMVLGCVAGTGDCPDGVNVGIGESSPSASLHITGPAAAPPSSLPAGHNGLLLGSNGTSSYKWVQTYGGPLVLNPVGNNVGIGTTTPSNIFTIAQGAGQAISDGWATYSSRRWKANIQTLRGALEKVEQLRGVSYDLKDSGKHEVGVIAEEVGAVVPEVVTYEENGKDARSVDYTRLTALLIEATKEQQALIHKQQEQIKAQHKQMLAQQAQLIRLNSQVRAIQTSLQTSGEDNSEVRRVKTQASLLPTGGTQ